MVVSENINQQTPLTMATLICFFIVFTLVFSYGDSREPRNNKMLPVFPQGRIVGGQRTDIREVPYQLQLEEEGFQFCGASIISARFALTAAHCTDGRQAFSLQVRSGSSYHAFGGYLTQVAAIYQHPLYNAQSTDYDVTVLHLLTAIPLNVNAQPISLADVEPMQGESAIVSGWGTEHHGSPSQPFFLQSAVIPIIDRYSCNAAYEHMITSRMICAGLPYHDSCQGDSGGPLVVNGVQVGIVSFGYGCALPGYPGVYSNVANLRSFIDMHTHGFAHWQKL